MTRTKVSDPMPGAGTRARGRDRVRTTHQATLAPSLPRSAAPVALSPAHVVSVQRTAGNRVAQRLVDARLARRIAAAGSGIRIQRVTNCTDWWATQPNPGGGEIDAANLRSYWVSISAERRLYLPKVMPADLLTGLAAASQRRAKLDQFAGVLTWCENFWRDTNADRDAAGITDTFASLTAEIAWSDIVDHPSLVEARSLWAELAGAVEQAGALKIQLHNSCTDDLLTKHIVGRTGPVSDEDAFAKALDTADQRSASASTVINLSGGTYLKTFEREVDGARQAKSNSLRTVEYFPVIHVEKKSTVQSGRASVLITRDSGGGQEKRFNHFSSLTWMGGIEPKKTDRNGRELAEASGTGGKGTKRGKK